MNKLQKITMLILALTLNSCEETKAEKLQNKWWLESGYGNQILQFSDDGKVRELNDDQVLDYSLDGELITLDDEKFKIKRLDEKYLELSNEDEEIKFRLANSKELLIGDWEGVYEDNEFKIYLKKDGDYKRRTEEETVRGKYYITDNILKLGSEEFKFIISEDLNNLSLILVRNRKIKLELYRDL
jgi:hypothetical protein